LENIRAVAVLYQLHETAFANFLAEKAVRKQSVLISREQRHCFFVERAVNRLQISIGKDL